jgi:hypothetical protein
MRKFLILAVLAFAAFGTAAAVSAFDAKPTQADCGGNRRC